MSDFDLLGREMRQDLSLDQLLNIEDVCVIFEKYGKDSDKAPYFVYTVGGFLNGEKLGGPEGGCLIGGQTIIVNARTRREADRIAYDGLLDTIDIENKRRSDAAKQHLDTRKNEGIIARIDEVSKRIH